VANEKQLSILKQGVNVWNKWREENPDNKIDLSYADLKGTHLHSANLSSAGLSSANLSSADLDSANLISADLSSANLDSANLDRANLFRANLSSANLSSANLSSADLDSANLSSAKLRSANLTGANLFRADLSIADLRSADLISANLISANLDSADLSRANLRSADLSSADLDSANLDSADLSSANLTGANLVEADLTGATLTGCKVYGISAWNLKLEGAEQSNLVITRQDEPTVTVDNLEVAQFVYLLLNNKNVRHVIDTITSKVVLILGRFTEERKAVLDALREELRKHDFSPIVFDFAKPASRDFTETVSTLAHMARFVIADITDAKAIPQELQKIVPNLPSLPVQPIILESQHEFGMFKDFGGYLSVLPPYRYPNTDDLLKSLNEKVIAPALGKAEEIAERRKAFEQELAKK
jgi:uncharacterized protein YjbI with pentapeptide repeats